MDRFEGNAVFLRCLLHPWNPVAGERTLVGIIQNKAILGHLWMSGAVLEFRRRGIRHKGQIHQIDPAVGYVRGLEALVGQELRIGEKFPLPSLGAQDADALFALRRGVPEARA